MARTLRLWIHLDSGDITSLLVDPDNPHIWVGFGEEVNGLSSIMVKNSPEEVDRKMTYKVPVERPAKRWRLW